ncbi:ATP-dependent helicase [Photobacterium sp. 2_MG-2023]|uniref:ATP-dependent helicase n=1 Tax=Photobacterium sp. 2_MG-2023 TaxID=3062663 RepID=UPI0026E16C53|nr:ATP-dependent helicase [Photobacterium sp. 2_MG-2023]MDO6580229.1 ATP-dependent helicase [Photobacterium sp. 2_MG-2023]
MMHFTSEQQGFIQHREGNALCIAGAGTGKTTTLVGLIQAQLDMRPASEMLVLMFNSDIRRDFQQKLNQSGITQSVPVHTFHSFCLRVLNQSGYLAESGYRVDFNPGENDKSLAKQVLRQMAGKETTYSKQQHLKEPKTLELLLSFVGLVKAHMLPPHEVFAMAGINNDYRFILDAYTAFEHLRQAQKLLFFDDWLVTVVSLFEQNALLRAHCQQQCRLLVVDEFQDINNAQYRLLKQLLGPDCQLIAVGDVDQCIYTWRGSAPQFMLNFERDFAPAQVYSLSQTFRFGHSLALAASHLIAHNQARFSDFLTVPADNIPDTQVNLIGSPRQVGEIVSAVQAYIEQGGQPDDIAILVRRWSQTLLFELAFLSKQIPYHMPVPSVLANSREVRLLMEVMTLAIGRFAQLNDQDRSALLFSLLSFPHCYVPNKALRPLCDQLVKIPDSRWVGFAERHAQVNPNLKLDNLIERLELFTRLQRKGGQKAFDVFEQYRRESGLDSWIWKTEATASEIEEAIDRLDAVSTVLESMDQRCEKALQYFEFYTAQSRDTGQGQADQKPRSASVQVTTIFRAKGCEYQRVFLPFWDKDAFPYRNPAATDMKTDKEEERRLAYVALTRAKAFSAVYYTDSEKKGKRNASTFVREAAIEQAKTIGPALYQNGPLPAAPSPVTERYYERVGRAADAAQSAGSRTPHKTLSRANNPSLNHAKLSQANHVSSAAYSYLWAIEQPLPDNAEKVIRSLLRTKNARYLDAEITRLLRDLEMAEDSKKPVLVKRLIAVSHARRQVLR